MSAVARRDVINRARTYRQPVMAQPPETVEDVVALADQVRGWLYPAEGRALYGLARGCTAGAIVEIGSYEGRSTTFLGWGSRHGSHLPVVAIDPHTGSAEHQRKNKIIWTYDHFMQNMRVFDLLPTVVPVVATSQAAAQRWTHQIGVLFIDGEHSYRAVLNDLLAFVPHLIPGAVVAFHDSTIAAYGVGRLLTHIQDRLPGALTPLAAVESLAIYLRGARPITREEL